MTVTSVCKLMKGLFSHWHICLLVFIVTVDSQAVRHFEGDIVIVGDNPGEGRVEVFLEDKWGTISAIELDEATPTVICRQKGFNGPVKIFSREDLVLSTSPEWNIKCSGGEESILDCQRIKREGTAEDDLSYSGFYDSASYDHDYTTWEHHNDLWVTCEELQESSPPPILMIILDASLFLMLFAFILCFAYLAYYFASRNKMKDDPKRGPDDYVSPFVPTAADEARYMAVNEKSKDVETIEEIKLKDLETDEEPDASLYATCK